MLLLSADTSGKYGSIALARCAPASCDVIEVVPLVGGTFSAQLIPQIAALLSQHGFSKHDIGALAVATGPGSFTGLRVGLAAIKALGETLQKPIAGVSLLEALAAAADHQAGPVLALMDAGRSEAYAGRYEPGVDGNLRMTAEDLVPLADLADVASGRHVVTSDENLIGAIKQQGFAVELVPRPHSDVIARLGWRKIQRGDTVPPEQLDANYIRRSDAEIFSNK